MVKPYFSGGAARIGDILEFVHDTFVDNQHYRSGLPLNIVMITDGQTQGDDKEQMEKWTKVLKKVSNDQV